MAKQGVSRMDVFLERMVIKKQQPFEAAHIVTAHIDEILSAAHSDGHVTMPAP